MNLYVRIGVLAVVAGGAASCAHVVPMYPPGEVCPELPAPEGATVSPRLIDDAEDGDDRIVVQDDGRAGFVFKFVDRGSELVGGTTLAGHRPVPLLGGAHGSRCAWNLRGRLGEGRIVFAGFGLNMLAPAGPYDASRFTGVSFYARRSAATADRVRVKFPDWSTNPDGNVCVECYNDFGQDIVLTEQWTKYTLPFASLRQEPGWGIPRPKHVDSSRLFSIQFGVFQRGWPLDIWIDDLEFTEDAPPPPAS